MKIEEIKEFKDDVKLLLEKTGEKTDASAFDTYMNKIIKELVELRRAKG